jgi:hypothetical protein
VIIMLEATTTTASTATTYAIPGNTIVIEDATSGGQIRPTVVVVTETDGEIKGFGFAGPRQFLLGGDARDQGSRVIGANELDLGDTEEELLGEVLMLHLRHAVHVLNEEETKDVLAQFVD